MAGGIYLIQDDGELVEMREQPYDSEELLQKLVAKYPNLLAGDQIDTEAPRKWLLIAREVSIASEEDGFGRWSVDHLFIDQDGIPTLVEVKRSTDTRIRREVVGQLLEYGANATLYWPVGLIQQKFEHACQDNGLEPEEEISELTGSFDQEAFWNKVESNLKMGKIRMIFLADEIPSELKRIVEFLNDQMNPAEILAVEIKQFVGHGLKTLVPRVIGQTSDAQQKKRSRHTGKQWDYDSFFEELEKSTDPEQATIAKKIYEWAKLKVDWIWWGRGKVEGSYVPTLSHGNVEHHLFAVRTKGQVELYFYHYQTKPPFDSELKRKELMDKLNAILTEPIPPEAITRLPKISLSNIKSPGKLEQFLSVYDWFINEVRGNEEVPGK